VWRPDDACHSTCLPDDECKGIYLPDPECHRICLPDADVESQGICLCGATNTKLQVNSHAASNSTRPHVYVLDDDGYRFSLSHGEYQRVGSPSEQSVFGYMVTVRTRCVTVFRVRTMSARTFAIQTQSVKVYIFPTVSVEVYDYHT
jgi:hypothetical protein